MRSRWACRTTPSTSWPTATWSSPYHTWKGSWPSWYASTKPGGHVHVLAEDYTMLHMMSGPLDPDVFWRKGPVEFAERTGTDSRIGRRAWTLMRAAGLIEVRVDYVVVDTLRVPRRVFADIITAWRDGYVDALSTPECPAAVVRQHFNEIIASILNPEHYAVWHVPIVSGVKPSAQCATKENGGPKGRRP